MDPRPPVPTAGSSDARAVTGARGEALAAAHLASLGHEVVACNWRLRAGELRGELDLVALDHAAGAVVVVEVKTRRGEGFGGPLAAVTPRKQAKVRALAAAFLLDAALPYRRVRFDVVGVLLRPGRAPELTHLQGAF
jgi:putative endonuclease